MKSKKPADLFEEMGIPEADWTEPMRLAVKQKWSGLRVDEKVDVLRKELAAVEAVAVPSSVTDPDEVKRLKRNAAVNAWRTRNQIQAALDARDLKFAALRAKRGKTVVVTSVSGDQPAELLGAPVSV